MKRLLMMLVTLTMLLACGCSGPADEPGNDETGNGMTENQDNQTANDNNTPGGDIRDGVDDAGNAIQNGVDGAGSAIENGAGAVDEALTGQDAGSGRTEPEN